MGLRGLPPAPHQGPGRVVAGVPGVHEDGEAHTACDDASPDEAKDGRGPATEAGEVDTPRTPLSHVGTDLSRDDVSRTQRPFRGDRVSRCLCLARVPAPKDSVPPEP